MERDLNLCLFESLISVRCPQNIDFVFTAVDASMVLGIPLASSETGVQWRHAVLVIKVGCGLCKEGRGAAQVAAGAHVSPRSVCWDVSRPKSALHSQTWVIEAVLCMSAFNGQVLQYAVW